MPPAYENWGELGFTKFRAAEVCRVAKRDLLNNSDPGDLQILDLNPQVKYLHNVCMSLAGIFWGSSFHKLNFHLWINEIFHSHLLKVQEQEKRIRCREGHGAFLCWCREVVAIWGGIYNTELLGPYRLFPQSEFLGISFLHWVFPL